MESKTTITKVTYRIEEKPGGGFVARPDDALMESLEGASREEVQQKIEDRLTALVEGQIHKQFKIGGADVQVNVRRSVSTKVLTGTPTSSVQTNPESIDSPPRFESNGRFWQVIAILIVLGAAILYLLKH